MCDVREFPFGVSKYLLSDIFTFFQDDLSRGAEEEEKRRKLRMRVVGLCAR